MKKSIVVIIALLAFIVGLILGVLLSGKFVGTYNQMTANAVKEYFDRTYTNGSIKVVFHKNKKFEYYTSKTYDVLQELPENSSTEELIYSGTYYYNSQAKVICFEYEKDGETWFKTASWGESDSNRLLKWQTGADSKGSPLYTTLTLLEDERGDRKLIVTLQDNLTEEDIKQTGVQLSNLESIYTVEYTNGYYIVSVANLYSTQDAKLHIYNAVRTVKKVENY